MENFIILGSLDVLGEEISILMVVIYFFNLICVIVNIIIYNEKDFFNKW